MHLVKLNKRKQSAGFTIIEVMMFLAISAAMFVIAFFGLSGSQDSVRFRDSLNSLEQRIDAVFSDVDRGYFGNSGDFSCSVAGPSSPPVVTQSAGGGNSQDCVFAGKEVYFRSSNTLVVDTRLAVRGDDARVSRSAYLREEYNVPNGVEYVNTKVNGNTYNLPSRLYVASLRGQTSTASVGAIRKWSSDRINWHDISDATSTQPVVCFAYGSKKGTLTVKQNNIEVEYNVSTC